MTSINLGLCKIGVSLQSKFAPTPLNLIPFPRGSCIFPLLLHPYPLLTERCYSKGKFLLLNFPLGWKILC